MKYTNIKSRVMQCFCSFNADVIVVGCLQFLLVRIHVNHEARQNSN